MKIYIVLGVLFTLVFGFLAESAQAFEPITEGSSPSISFPESPTPHVVCRTQTTIFTQTRALSQVDVTQGGGSIRLTNPNSAIPMTYCLTGNLITQSPQSLFIIAGQNIRLNLNGFTVTAQNQGSIAISTNLNLTTGTPWGSFRVEQGRFVGFREGIQLMNANFTDFIVDRVSFTGLTGHAIFFSRLSGVSETRINTFRFIDSEVRGGLGISIQGYVDHATIEDNIFTNLQGIEPAAALLFRSNSFVFQRNEVSVVGGWRIRGVAAGTRDAALFQVEDNTFTLPNHTQGSGEMIAVEGGSSRTSVQRNTVRFTNQIPQPAQRGTDIVGIRMTQYNGHSAVISGNSIEFFPDNIYAKTGIILSYLPNSIGVPMDIRILGNTITNLRERGTGIFVDRVDVFCLNCTDNPRVQIAENRIFSDSNGTITPLLAFPFLRGIVTKQINATFSSNHVRGEFVKGMVVENGFIGGSNNTICVGPTAIPYERVRAQSLPGGGMVGYTAPCGSNTSP